MVTFSAASSGESVSGWGELEAREVCTPWGCLDGCGFLWRLEDLRGAFGLFGPGAAWLMVVVFFKSLKGSGAEF